jgi:hypothetical protein
VQTYVATPIARLSSHSSDSDMNQITDKERLYRTHTPLYTRPPTPRISQDHASSNYLIRELPLHVDPLLPLHLNLTSSWTAQDCLTRDMLERSPLTPNTRHLSRLVNTQPAKGVSPPPNATPYTPALSPCPRS